MSTRKPLSIFSFSGFCLLLMLLPATRLAAQDEIVMRDSTRIQAEVDEVSEKQIKYRKFINQSGPTYTLNIKKVDRIEYQNGYIEYFNRGGKVASGGGSGGNVSSGGGKSPRAKKSSGGGGLRLGNWFRGNGSSGSSDKAPAYVGLGGGLSLLSGDMAAVNGDNPGYAMDGYDFNVHGAYFMPFFKYVGIGASAGINQYGADADAAIADIGLADGLNIPGLDNVTQEITAQDADWQATYFTAGPVLSYSFGKLAVDLNAQAGLMFLTQPEVNGDLGGQSITPNFDDSRKPRFQAINMGLGLVWNFKK